MPSQNSSPGSYNPGASDLDHLMASGELLGQQMPQPSAWTPELRLAGAVLASALVEVRDRAHDKAYRHKVKQDLEWIASEDAEWPFSFVRLCQLFHLEPAWVRSVAQGWITSPGARQEPIRYRQAA